MKLLQTKLHGAITSYDEQTLPDTIYFPAYSISPEEIFQGKILLFNVDFFGEPTKIKEATVDRVDEDGNPVTTEDGSPIKDVKFYYYEDENGEDLDIDGDGKSDGVKGYKTSKQDIAADLSSTISRWYVAIRNIALVAMMIVLLYIGIRMLLSTLASDKAKYRQMLQDWLLGIVLLFFMHYIMAFCVTAVQKLTDVVSASIDKQSFYALIPLSEDSGKREKMVDFITEAGLEDCFVDANKESSDSENAAAILYPTNLLGYLRIDVQLAQFGTSYIGKAICFVVLVLMTVFFVYTYLRRVLYMAFLTLMAPIVAVTYPIDKMNDGSAQGFNKWFREYIFNILIQPLHLLLYYILVTSAFNLAAENVLYSIIAIGFMMPAEKLLRSFFGFQKSETAGAFGGVAGAAMVMSGLKNIASIGSKKGGSSEKSKTLDSGDDGKVRESKVSGGDVDETDTMYNALGTDGAGGESVAPVVGGAVGGAVVAGAANNKQSTQDTENNEEQTGNEREVNPELTKEDIERLKAQDLEANRPYAMGEMEYAEKRKLKNQPLKQRAKRRAYKIAKSSPRYIIPAARTMGKVFGGTMGAALGVAAGVATGDISNTLTYGTAGAVAGSTLGRNALNLEQKPEAKAKLDRAYQRYIERNPDFKEAENSKQIRAKVEAAKETFLDNGYTKDEVETLSYNGTLGRYAANNVSAKDMVTIEKMKEDMEKDNKVLTTEQGIAISKYNEKYGEDLASGKKRQETRKAIKEHFKEKKNVSDAQAEALEKGTTGYIDKFRKTGKNVKN